MVSERSRNFDSSITKVLPIGITNNFSFNSLVSSQVALASLKYFIAFRN